MPTRTGKAKRVYTQDPTGRKMDTLWNSVR